MVFASTVPFIGAQSPLNLLKFVGLKLTADSAGLVGFEDILTLTSRGIVIEINQGTKMALTAPARPSTGRSASPAHAGPSRSDG